VWAGVDNAWEQKKLDSGENAWDAAESPASGARFVSPLFV